MTSNYSREPRRTIDWFSAALQLLKKPWECQLPPYEPPMKREIAKLVADGLHKEAISLYSMRHSASLHPDKFTFPPLLKACTKLNSLPLGRVVHAQVMKTGFSSDVYPATALTDMYMKFSCPGDAVKVFDEMPLRNLASLNAIISGFSLNGCSREALCAFKEMDFYRLRPNSTTIVCLLSGCGSIANGMEILCWSIKLGVQFDVYVATALLTLYLRCREFVSAEKVFEEMSYKNVVSYNAFMSGLLQNGMPFNVLDVFKRMRGRPNCEINAVTLASVVAACSCLFNLRVGRQVHGLTVKLELENPMLGNVLVDMYSKCGAWMCAYSIFKELKGIRDLYTWNSLLAGMMINDQAEIAIELFELLESEGVEPDLVTWNSMISGFSQLGRDREAFNFFKRMQSTGKVPNLRSLTSLLSACSNTSSLQRGEEIHGYAIKNFMTTDAFLATALIDMYMKSGHSCQARRIFDLFDKKPNDPAFWNAMISGHGRNGENESAFEIFYQMLEEKVNPTVPTFTSILSVCSHTGRVEKGWKIFRMMKCEFALQPILDHYGCMVDLLGRSGQLDKAREIIRDLPYPSSSIFSSLLGACRYHLDSELGEEMAMKIFELEPENPTPFVILSNIYAALERWEDVERVREVMDSKGLTKLPGTSWSDIKESTYN